MPAVYGLAVSAKERKDEVKLGTSLAKIVEEDPSIRIDNNQDTNEMVLWGQGEMHLRVALETAWRANTASRRKPGRGGWDIRKASASRSNSAGGTRNSPADTGSSATWW